jgi:hypothetical protein
MRLSGLPRSSDMPVGIGDLHFELRVLLSQAFGDNIVNEAVAVFEFVTAGLLTSQAYGGGVLILGDRSNHEIDFSVVERRVRVGAEIRRGRLDAADDGCRCSTGV